MGGGIRLCSCEGDGRRCAAISDDALSGSIRFGKGWSQDQVSPMAFVIARDGEFGDIDGNVDEVFIGFW